MRTLTTDEAIIAARQERAARLQTTMTCKEIEIADRMDRIRNQRCVTSRDAEISEYIATMKASLTSQTDSDKPHRMLLVTGDSNAGKSQLVDFALDSDKSLQPHLNERQELMKPVLRITGPAPFTHRNLGVEIVAATGYPVKSDISESFVWPLVKERLFATGVAFIVIDEAQRTLKLNDKFELQKVSDNFIGLTDSKIWPVRLILLGVDPLPSLREKEQQIENRSEIMNLGPVPMDAFESVAQWIREIIVDHAQLRCAASLDLHGVAKRLIHACDGNMGSIVTLIRSAVEQALVAERQTVWLVDFAQAYTNKTKCTLEQNVFEQKRWAALASGLAKLKSKDEDADSGLTASKPLKSGKRPR
jgi:hypothetical protein